MKLSIAAIGLLASVQAAHAMDAPTYMPIDGGPLGPIQISGGMEGYFWGVTGTGTSSAPGKLGDRPDGMNAGSILIRIRKNTGVLRFSLEAGVSGGTVTLGTLPKQASISKYTTGPLRAGVVTFAPEGQPFTISAGQFGSLEGYESGEDWNNANQLTTALYASENSQSRGVEAGYKAGRFSVTAAFSDGWDTGVFNYLQALVGYKFNKKQQAYVFFGGNLGRTGLSANIYGDTTVAKYGAYFPNSQKIGAYYSYTVGNLNLVPMIQYQWAKQDHAIGLKKFSSTFGIALFSDYQFGTSPYSIGAWADYWTSHGPDNWFVGAGSAGEGISIAPTWQYKNLFVRADGGALYLNKIAYEGGTPFGYGSNRKTRYMFTGLLEGGLLF